MTRTMFLVAVVALLTLAPSVSATPVGNPLGGLSAWIADLISTVLGFFAEPDSFENHCELGSLIDPLGCSATTAVIEPVPRP